MRTLTVIVVSPSCPAPANLPLSVNSVTATSRVTECEGVFGSGAQRLSDAVFEPGCRRLQGCTPLNKMLEQVYVGVASGVVIVLLDACNGRSS
jgi:hypothetical protein